MYDQLDVHFLNVGHGDCTIIRHPGTQNRDEGRVTIVDINDWSKFNDNTDEQLVAGLSYYLDQDSSQGALLHKQISEEEYAEKYLDDPVTYYNDVFSGLKNRVWRFISTHPDMDHLSGIRRFHDEIGFDVLWETGHDKEMDTGSGWNEEYNREDWYRYQEIRDDETSTNPIQPERGELGNYWEQDNIQILHPTEALVEDADNGANGYNDVSYVLKVKHRDQSLLLPGDIESDGWEAVLDNHSSRTLSDVNILKASHHGRRSGFHREAVELMDPDTVIVSVGNKDEYDAHDRYLDACSDDTDILSTRQYGTIRAIVRRGAASIQCAEPDGIFDLPDEN